MNTEKFLERKKKIKKTRKVSKKKRSRGGTSLKKKVQEEVTKEKRSGPSTTLKGKQYRTGADINGWKREGEQIPKMFA